MRLPADIEEARIVFEALKDLPEAERKEHLRTLYRADLYCLLRYGCGRHDIEHPWLFERCREVQASPNGHLDLWSREHYKSTAITFGLTLFDILNNPEITVGVLSHTRPMAKAFVQQIKVEVEKNEQLKALFSDVLWSDPAKESPRWSLDDGLVFKREGNPREPTIYASGLVDGMPTGFHFKLRVYDDVVTAASVTSPEMMQRTAEAWQLSDNLGTVGGVFRVVGTRYHANDMYGQMLTSRVVKPRVYPCTRDGTERFTDDNCVLMSHATLIEKRRVQGVYTFGTQMLLNPKGDESQGFRREWLQFMDGRPHTSGLSIFITVDPAHSKKKGSDYSVFAVIGLGRDGVYRLLDMVRDRLSLTEKAETLMELWGRWRPVRVGYEQVGMQSDIAHIRTEQHRQSISFPIIPLGAKTAKVDRIRQLVPLFEQRKFLLPRYLHRTDREKKTHDLVQAFVEEEYVTFPVGQHDDMLDCIAMVLHPDLNARAPGGGLGGPGSGWARPEVQGRTLPNRRRSLHT